MLELAAKAAGHKEVEWGRSCYEGRHRGADVLLLGPRKQVMEDPDQIEWNPLTDDGAALRLAVKLRLQITTGRLGCWISGLSCPEDIKVDFIDFTPECDEMRIVRRAIVRAAAAIGESMPT